MSVTLPKTLELAQRALDCFVQDRPQEALTFLTQGRALEPDSTEINYAIAVALARLEHYNDACDVLETLILEHPEFPAAPPLFEQIYHQRLIPDSFMRTEVVSIKDSIARCPDEGTIVTLKLPLAQSHSKPLWCAVAKNITVAGRHSVLINTKGQILRESTIDECTHHAAKDIVNPARWRTKATKRPGTYMILSGYWSDGFYHWIMEWLPRIFFAEALGLSPVYVVPAKKRFVRESLAMLGISDDRIIEADGSAWIPEQLIIPQTIMPYFYKDNPEILFTLRKRFLETFPSDTPKGPERIYITRSNPSRPRRVTNEEVLTSYGERYGITSVDMETLSFREQIRQVKDASLLIGPHGAGMIHCLFMKPQGCVIELVAPTYINPNTYPACQHLGHRLYIIPSYLNGGTYQHGDDIEINTLILELTLTREIFNPRPLIEGII